MQPNTFKPKTVTTRAEVEKEVEKELAHLVYMDGMAHDQARQKAQDFIYNKYSEVMSKAEKDKK